MITGSSPFEAIAADYDATFTQTRLGGWLRDLVREQLRTIFRAGEQVLELGCGTGEDAVWLAQRGIQVTATDAAPAMIEVARRKVDTAGLAGRVELARLDLNDAPAWAPGRTFDGVLSNFGALNCLADRHPIARALAGWLRPGGRAALVVMGPFCPWEITWHLFHGQVRNAVRRFRSGVPAHIGAGVRLPVWYPSPCRIRSEFTPFFRHTATVGIGVLLPPTYLGHLIERRPGLFYRLAVWERRWHTHFPWNWLNDHYLIVFERRRNEP